MPLTIAEHIAEFTGRKAKFRVKEFEKFLRKTRRTAKRKPDNNKPTANADGVEIASQLK